MTGPADRLLARGIKNDSQVSDFSNWVNMDAFHQDRDHRERRTGNREAHTSSNSCKSPLTDVEGSRQGEVSGCSLQLL